MLHSHVQNMFRVTITMNMMSRSSPRCMVDDGEATNATRQDNWAGSMTRDAKNGSRPQKHRYCAAPQHTLHI
jgi:hypothetical protein